MAGAIADHFKIVALHCRTLPERLKMIVNSITYDRISQFLNKEFWPSGADSGSLSSPSFLIQESRMWFESARNR
jgi:hypothetical protein